MSTFFWGGRAGVVSDYNQIGNWTHEINGGKKLDKAPPTTIMSDANGAMEIGIFLSRMCQFLIGKLGLPMMHLQMQVHPAH